MPNLEKYSYRVLPFNLTAGLADFELPIDAEKITYASPTDGPEITVRLQSRSNDGIPLRPQGELVAPFTRAYLSAPAAAKTIYLLIGAPKEIQLAGRDVAISGDVNTKDWFRMQVESGRVFRRYRQMPASTGNYPYHQVYNPVGSGKTVQVYNMDSALLSVVQSVVISPQNTPLANLGGNFHNSLAGGPVSVAQYRYEYSSAWKGTVDWTSIELQANVPGNDLPVNYILTPGTGLLFVTGSVNIRLNLALTVIEY